MGAPDSPLTPAALDRIVEDQALEVLAVVDDLGHDLPGSVHDARVAVRKLRSTLVVFRPLLDPERSAALAAELRWFAGTLSDARDAQVVRSRVTTALHAAAADPGDRDLLLAELDRMLRPAWVRAGAALVEPRTAALVAALPDVRLRGLALPAVDGDVLRERSAAQLDDLLVLADKTLAGKAGDKRLHDLRKRVKRVRFALASLRGSGRNGTARVVHALEDLQDDLGAYQDAVVTAELLDRLGTDTPRVAPLAGVLAERERTAARTARDAFGPAVARVRRAAKHLDRAGP
ncbi:CHAD domain-containing protein [Marmoricola sp. RAF53]|uniref:CHAD domain-containing protein n=1 Tax=Marmoricola sp. RAF53 TaxID=3233059 RepID=UPI003F9BF85A